MIGFHIQTKLLVTGITCKKAFNVISRRIWFRNDVLDQAVASNKTKRTPSNSSKNLSYQIVEFVRLANAQPFRESLAMRTHLSLIDFGGA